MKVNKINLVKKLILTAAVWGLGCGLIIAEVVKGFLSGYILGSFLGPITIFIWFGWQ